MGAAAFLNDFPRTAWEIAIAIAGPAVSLALVGICKLSILALIYWMGRLPYHFRREHATLLSSVSLLKVFLRIGLMVNWVLAVFNLLPCFPMDGGRILRSLLAVVLTKLTRRPPEVTFLTATKIATRWVAWPLALGAIVFTVTYTHIWMHLALFPLVLLFGELEYRMLRGETPQPSRLTRTRGSVRFPPLGVPSRQSTGRVKAIDPEPS